MKTLKDIKSMKGKRALVRVDYNVPMKGNKILDTRRIDTSFATIRALQKKGMLVRLVAHLGDGKASLKPVADYLSKHFKVEFVTGPITDSVANPPSAHSGGGGPKGTVLLFENIRKYEGEENNDPKFAKTLSKLGDIYVNEAFSVSHRKHASIVGVTKYLPSYAGLQLETEIKTLSKILTNKKHPFLFILGGAKFSTKMPLLDRFIKIADQVVIAGAILNSFYKFRGFEVGKSVVEDGYDKQIKKLLSSPKLLLPIDAVVTRGDKKAFASISEIQSLDVIEDIGPLSVKMISKKIEKAQIIVWNGPTGWYEKGFVGGTV
ncbi:MAG: phosphoglycerate kinase, partial [Patescibacteria group bacterium]